MMLEKQIEQVWSEEGGVELCFGSLEFELIDELPFSNLIGRCALTYADDRHLLVTVW